MKTIQFKPTIVSSCNYLESVLQSMDWRIWI